MRKLSFAIAFAAITFVTEVTFAQNEIAKTNEVTQSEAVEIAVHELPETVIAVVTSNFTEHTTAKAFKTFKGEKEFYLVIYTKEDIKEEVLFNVEGKVIEQKNTAL